VSVRAGIVVTGTEVLTGRVSDRNGPWLAERLREYVDEHPDDEALVDRLASWLARLDDDFDE